LAEIERLKEHIRSRATELRYQKKQGAKIIGYIPSGYVPDELLWASGAIPIGLIRGGDHEPVITSEAYLWRFIDTFSRCQIGYRIRGEEPIYQLPDLIIALTTDRNILAAAEMWMLNTHVKVFKYGVPSKKYTPQAFAYYLNGLRLLKQKLEEFTGMQIPDVRLKEQIDLANRMRDLLREISDSRKYGPPLISGKDFIALNHATYFADRRFLVKALESIVQEIKKTTPPKPAGPRIMLTGSTLAYGDSKVVDLLEEAGANIVIEEFSEGIRHYWQNVEPGDDLLVSLADRYLRKRPAPAFFKMNKEEKFSFLLNLIKEFSVDGVVWYSLMYRDSYDRWSILFPRTLEKEVGIPFLKLLSDYDPSEAIFMRTRIQAFIETIKQGGK